MYNISSFHILVVIIHIVSHWRGGHGMLSIIIRCYFATHIIRYKCANVQFSLKTNMCIMSENMICFVFLQHIFLFNILNICACVYLVACSFVHLLAYSVCFHSLLFSFFLIFYFSFAFWHIITKCGIAACMASNISPYDICVCVCLFIFITQPTEKKWRCCFCHLSNNQIFEPIVATTVGNNNNIVYNNNNNYNGTQSSDHLFCSYSIERVPHVYKYESVTYNSQQYRTLYEYTK